MDREPPSFKISNRIYFKTNNQENGISSGDLDTGLFVLSVMDTTCTSKTRPWGRQCHQIHHTGEQTTNQPGNGNNIMACNIKDVVLKPPMEFRNINTQFGRARKYINHPANLSIIMLNN